MGAFLALIWNGFREARRQRVTTVVAAFALVLLLSTSLVTEVTIWTFERVVTDFGLGTMSLMLAVLAIYLACGLLPREVERRTIFLIVTRPISRTRFLLARLLGNMLTLLVLELLMTAAFFAQLALLQAPLTQAIVASLLGLYVELFVITAAGFFFSAFSSQVVAALCTIGLYWAGHLSRELYRLGERSQSELVKDLVQGLYYVVPNLERVNFKILASLGSEVPMSMLGSGVLYCVAFGVAFTAAAALLFERRDFR